MWVHAGTDCKRTRLMREQFLNALGCNENKLLSHSASTLKILQKEKNAFYSFRNQCFSRTKNSTHFYVILSCCSTSETYTTPFKNLFQYLQQDWTGFYVLRTTFDTASFADHSDSARKLRIEPRLLPVAGKRSNHTARSQLFCFFFTKYSI